MNCEVAALGKVVRPEEGRELPAQTPSAQALVPIVDTSVGMLGD
jgi:hypothetical protein